MKKLLSLLAALMLLMTCCTAFAQTNFDGHWDVVKMSGLGVTIDVPKGDIWMELDGDKGKMYITGETFNYTVSYSGDTCIIKEAGEENYTATLNASGQLEMVMKGDETITMIMEREGGAPAAAAQTTTAVGFDGVWEAESYELMGMTLAASEVDMTLTLTIEGSKATLNVDGDKATCNVTINGNTCVLSDHTSDTIPCTLREDGVLVMEMESDGMILVVNMTRQEGTAAAQPAQTGNFDGVWTAKSYELMGMTLSASEVDMTLTLTIEGSKATLNVDGDKATCNVTINGNTCILSDHTSDTIPCTLREDGVLVMEMESDGMILTVNMVRK